MNTDDNTVQPSTTTGVVAPNWVPTVAIGTGTAPLWTPNSAEPAPEAAVDSRVLGAFAQIAGRPWCIKPESLDLIADAFNSGVYAMIDDDEEGPSMQKQGAVAVIPLAGVITPRTPGGILGKLLGLGGGLGEFKQNMAEAMRDDSVKSIVLDVDSPGGLVDQVPETAAMVRRLREHKPITAVANTTAGSAAYWIASQADELVVTPSGEVGSVGCYMLHRDRSAKLAAEGIKTTLTSAGRFKTEGNEFQPLSQEAQAAQQRKVNLYYDRFTADVAAGRKTTADEVKAGYGEGRTMLADEAVEHGLADRVGTLDSVVHEAVTGAAPSAARAMDLDRARQRADVLLS